MNLRRWLRRDPRPARFRVDGRDVAIPSSGNVWADLESTILALGGTRIEAIAADGALIRATELESDADGEPVVTAPAPGQHAASDIAIFARLISEAHDAGAKRHAQAYELAFARHTELVAILAQRLSGLETAWQKAMNQLAQAQAEAAMASATPPEDPAAGAIAAMLASGMSAGMLNGKGAKT